jgi:hypothetical protein
MVSVTAEVLPVVTAVPKLQLIVEPRPKKPKVSLNVNVSPAEKLFPTDVVVPSVRVLVYPSLLSLPGAAYTIDRTLYCGYRIPPLSVTVSSVALPVVPCR